MSPLPRRRRQAETTTLPGRIIPTQRSLSPLFPAGSPSHLFHSLKLCMTTNNPCYFPPGLLVFLLFMSIYDQRRTHLFTIMGFSANGRYDHGYGRSTPAVDWLVMGMGIMHGIWCWGSMG